MHCGAGRRCRDPQVRGSEVRLGQVRPAAGTVARRAVPCRAVQYGLFIRTASHCSRSEVPPAWPCAILFHRNIPFDFILDVNYLCFFVFFNLVFLLLFGFFVVVWFFCCCLVLVPESCFPELWVLGFSVCPSLNKTLWKGLADAVAKFLVLVVAAWRLAPLDADCMVLSSDD